MYLLYFITNYKTYFIITFNNMILLNVLYHCYYLVKVIKATNEGIILSVMCVNQNNSDNKTESR